MTLGAVQLARRYPGNPLIQAVVRRTKDPARLAREQIQVGTPGADPAAAPQGMRPAGLEQAIQMCAQIADLLARTVPAAQAAEFKDWLLTIAEGVATAAVEGHGPSVEGAPESDLEATALGALAGALRVAPATSAEC